jgi:hypothetical protein
MCRHGWTAALLLLGWVSVLERDAAAQSTAEFRRRVAVLERVAQRVHDTVATLARVRTRQLTLDTLRHGPLIMIVAPTLRTLAQAAADSIWPLVEHTYGRAANSLAATPIVVQAPFAREGSIPPQPGTVEAMVLSESITTADVVSSLILAVTNRLTQEADSGLTDWTRGALIPWSESRARDAAAYFELVMSPWHRVQDCERGDLQACRLALGLDGREDPGRRWYDAGERPMAVAGSWGLQPPLGVTARLGLLDFALHLGGTDAYARLMASRSHPIADRLAAAAGIGVDSLVATWRAQVLAARPATVAVEPLSAGSRASSWVAPPSPWRRGLLAGSIADHSRRRSTNPRRAAWPT